MRSGITTASAILLLFFAKASAQDALMDAFSHCNDTSRSNDERILACSQAAHAQGVTPDEQSFAYVDLGLAYDGKGDHDNAIKALSSAVSLQPDLWQGYFNRGQVYVEQGNPDAALADYNRLVQIDPAKVAMYRSMIADYRTLPEGVSTNMSSSEREVAAQCHGPARGCPIAYPAELREMAGAQSFSAALTGLPSIASARAGN